MKSFLKIFVAFVTIVAGGAAFAQWPAGCLPAAQVQGQPPKCYDGRQLNPYTGQWGWPVQAAAPQVQYAPQQYVVPQYAPQPYYGGQQYYGQPNYSGLPYGAVPIHGNPGFFRHDGNVYRCSAAAGWGGGLLGTIVGYAIGKNVTINGHRLSGAGAVLGAVAGNQIACELVRPSAPVPVYTPQPQMMAPQPMVQQYAPQMVAHSGPPVPAEQQVGGYAMMNQPVRRIHEPSDCDIDNVPELQDLKGLTGAQCAAVAKLAAIRGIVQSDTVAQAPTPPAPQVPQVDTKTYGAVFSAKKNANGYPCFVGDKQGNLLADFMDIERNPYKELATSGPKCTELVKRFSEENKTMVTKN